MSGDIPVTAVGERWSWLLGSRGRDVLSTLYCMGTPPFPADANSAVVKKETCPSGQDPGSRLGTWGHSSSSEKVYREINSAWRLLPPTLCLEKTNRVRGKHIIAYPPLHTQQSHGPLTWLVLKAFQMQQGKIGFSLDR